MNGNLRARLARLTPATVVQDPPAAASPLPGSDGEPSPASSLPYRLRARDERRLRRALDDLPGQTEFTPEGEIYVARAVYPPSHRHGMTPLCDALDASPRDLARIALDAKLESFRADEALFLDTETSGLSGGTGTIPFLIGLGRFEGGAFVVEQLFIREPAEERAALAYLCQRLEQCGAIVSFNGKSFDVPLLRTRLVLNRLAPPPPSLHLDLLHPSRRVWRRRLGQCRLTSLESHKLGLVREGDVPGSMIPGIYHDYLSSGFSDLLESVFTHNKQDVVALPALLGLLGRACARPEDEPELDRIGFAQAALRTGSADRAEQILGGIEAREGRILYAQVLRRRGARADAAAVWRELLRQNPRDTDAHLALAKHTEHVEKDPARALEHARSGAAAEGRPASDKRIARLVRKLGLFP